MPSRSPDSAPRSASASLFERRSAPELGAGRPTVPEPPAPVRAAEIERTALLFSLLFLAALVLVMGRAARDALFLTRFPVSWIAPMWLAYAGASSILALVYARIADRFARARFLVGFTVFAAVSYAVLRLLIGQELSAAYAVLYVWSEVIANFTAVLVWALAQELHDARSAKRLFGVIGAGQVVGIAVSGFGTGAIVPLVGTANLLLVLVAALLGIAALTVVVARRHPAPAAPASREQALEARLETMPVWRSRYVVSLALMTLTVFAMLTVGDYQFKAIARSAYSDRDELARFMANFYGVLGVAGVLVQVAVTPRLLRRYGVLGGMLAMPVAFVAASVGLVAAPNVALAALLKGSDNGLQFTVHEATMQLLYFPFPAALRDRVRTLVGAIFKPVGCACGAALLLWLAPGSAGSEPGPDLVHLASRLGLYTIPLGLAVVFAMPLVRAGYVDAMRRTLIRREIEPGLVENSPSARAILGEALRSNDSPQVVFAVDRLREIDPDCVREALPELCRHRSPRVRGLAHRLTAELGHADGAALAREALGDPDATVRIAAVEALASHLREDAHDELCALADAKGDDAVRTAAIAALVRHCGLDGMLDGAPRLRALLESASTDDRIAAARVLGMVGEASLQRALARLLADREPAVRRAAIQAAATACDARLLPALLEALGERGVAGAAARAITSLGDAAVAELAVRLVDPDAPRTVRLAIPRVLYRIGTEHALGVLFACLDERDDAIRQKVLASASRLRLALHAPPLPRAEVTSRIDREIAAHALARDEFVAVRSLVSRPLLDEHVLGGLRKGLVRILRLCELCYPREVVASVRARIFGSDPSLRANAFEVLESLLDRALRARLVDLFDTFIRVRAGDAPPVGLQPRASYAVSWLRGLIRGADPWGAALAFDAIAHHRIVGSAPDALDALGHPDPLVRENAAIATAVLMPPGAPAALARLQGDPDPVVASYARYWAETGKSGTAPEDAMYTTIEKVLFLQRVPVFSRVAGDDLVPLARGAVVVPLRRGDVVFREGEPGGALYFVISGTIRLSVQGREIARLGANDVFGEMSIFDREPRASTATAADEAELLRVSAEDFHEAVRDTAEIAEAVIQVLNRRLREADRRLAAARSRLSLELKPPTAAAAARDAAPVGAIDGAAPASLDGRNGASGDRGSAPPASNGEVGRRFDGETPLPPPVDDLE